MNLDLASIEGGAHGPAQYYGLTHDDRAVYCLYRGGGLSVSVASKPGIDVDHDPDAIDLMIERVGPPGHMTMTSDQLAEIAGITLNGKPIPASLARPEDDFRQSVWDLSGAVTFYNVSVEASTEARRRFFEALLRLADCTIFQHTEFKNGKVVASSVIEQASDVPQLFNVYFGKVPSDTERLTLFDRNSPAPNGILIYGGRIGTEGRFLIFQAQFFSDDEVARSHLAKLDALLDQHFDAGAFR